MQFIIIGKIKIIKYMEAHMNEVKTEKLGEAWPSVEVRYTHETTQVMAAEVIEKIPPLLTEFRCAYCERVFGSLSELQAHYTSEHPDAVVPRIITLHINSRYCQVLVEPHWTLKRTLQYRLGLTGTKEMCDKGVCGSCTVIMDGRPILSCTTLAVECEGKDIQTIEGIAAELKNKPLIDAYCKWDAMQCGYCTPGFLVTAKALLDKFPEPTEEQIKEALSGNICSCGTYPRHITAIMEASEKMRQGA